MRLPFVAVSQTSRNRTSLPTLHAIGFCCRFACRRMSDSSSPAPGSASPASPRVSVLLVTYNHATYIAQAVESILAQQVIGGWELVIAEDCSTDGTRQILEEFARAHPD